MQGIGSKHQHRRCDPGGRIPRCGLQPGARHCEDVLGHVAVLKVNPDTGAVEINKTLDLMNHNAAYSRVLKEIWTSQMDTPGSVLVLDSDTLYDVSTTITVDHMPAEVTLSADGKMVFVANDEMTNDFWAVDAASESVLNKLYVAKVRVGYRGRKRSVRDAGAGNRTRPHHHPFRNAFDHFLCACTPIL
jgi:hypothetical protein